MVDLNNTLISPQIKEDGLYNWLYKIAKNPRVRTFLEIGCSSGDGSTEAIIKGLKENPNYPQVHFYGVEASPIRFKVLIDKYRTESFARFYNVITVPLEEAVTDQEIQQYYKQYRHMDWLDIDAFMAEKYLQYEYFINLGIDTNGIESVQRDAGTKYFDAVFIDGGAYTGYAEFKRLYGAKFMIFDDILVPKCLRACEDLEEDIEYMLIAKDKNLRFGFSVHKKI